MSTRCMYVNRDRKLCWSACIHDVPRTNHIRKTTKRMFNTNPSCYRSFYDRTLPPIPSIAALHFHFAKDAPTQQNQALMVFASRAWSTLTNYNLSRDQKGIPTVAVTRTLICQCVYMSFCSGCLSGRHANGEASATCSTGSGKQQTPDWLNWLHQMIPRTGAVSG